MKIWACRKSAGSPKWDFEVPALWNFFKFSRTFVTFMDKRAYSRLLASSASMLRSPLTRLTWAKSSCPSILSLR